MSARKAKPPVEVVEETLAAAEAAQVASDVQAALEGIPPDTVLRVERRNDETKLWDYCSKFGPDEFSVDKVQSMYGGGYYRVQARWTDTRTNRSVIGKTKVFTVVGPPKWAAEVQTGTPVVQADGVRPGATVRDSIMDMGLMQVFKQMGDNSTMQMELMRSMASRPSVDWGAVIGAAAPIVAALIAQRADPMDLAAKMADAMARPAREAERAPVSEMMEVLQLGIRLARGQMPSDDKDGTTEMVNKGLDVVKTFAESLANRRSAAPGPVAVVEHPTYDANAPLTPTLAMPTRLWLQGLAPFRSQFVALSGLWTPAAAASQLLGLVNDDVLNDLLDDYDTGTPEEFVSRALPVLGLPPERAPWLTEVLQHVVGALEPESENADPLPPSPSKLPERSDRPLND